MDNQDRDKSKPEPSFPPEPGRGAENPLDQRRAHQDRGLRRFPGDSQPEESEGDEDTETTDPAPLVVAVKGTCSFAKSLDPPPRLCIWNCFQGRSSVTL